MSPDVLVILAEGGKGFDDTDSGVGLLCPAKEEHPTVINAVERRRNLVIYSPRPVRYRIPLNSSLNVPCG